MHSQAQLLCKLGEFQGQHLPFYLDRSARGLTDSKFGSGSGVFPGWLILILAAYSHFRPEDVVSSDWLPEAVAG